MLIFCLMSLFAFMSIFVFMGVLQGDQNFVMNLNCDQEENSNFFACVEDQLFIKKTKKICKIFHPTINLFQKQVMSYTPKNENFAI